MQKVALHLNWEGTAQVFTWRKVALLAQLPCRWRLKALSRPALPGQGLGSILACVCPWDLAQHPLQEVPTLFCADQHVQWALSVVQNQGHQNPCFGFKLKTARPLISDPSETGMASEPQCSSWRSSRARWPSRFPVYPQPRLLPHLAVWHCYTSAALPS